MKSYPGQKKIYGFYHKIINEIPAHENYFELFAGSAAIASLLNTPLTRPRKMFLNDIDRSVTDRLNCIFLSEGITIGNKNYIDIIKSKLTNADKKTFVLLDPPYHHDTRPNNTELYEYEMTNRDHSKFITSVLQLKCNCMVIHPACELYDTKFASWRQVEVKVRYHKKTSLEKLYMNYDKPKELQAYKFLGKDCWDRQRIQRKAIRLVSKLDKLPEQERRYVIHEVVKKFG